jgi:hypothetical protein
MNRFQAEVATTNGSRYLQQLCKHWSHKFEVTFDPQHGTIALPACTCTLDATETSLKLVLDGPDAAAMPRMCDVVAEHLQRFAFREQLEVQWTAAE